MMMFVEILGKHVKLNSRQQRALACVNMSGAFTCMSYPEGLGRPKDRLCPIICGEKDKDFCPFKGIYGYHTATQLLVNDEAAKREAEGGAE